MSQAPVSDDVLLRAFVFERDAGAFDQLARRHAGMVLGVCQAVLGNGADAEDAAQAVFLTLLTKARSLVHHPTLGGWLHQVAWHVAVRSRRTRANRARYEREAAQMNTNIAGGASSVPADLLHEALMGLPDRYRVPLVLHHLEGYTQEQAARMLDCKIGTLSGRLTRGRHLLAGRLRKMGVTAGVAAVTGALSSATASAAPTGLMAAINTMATSALAGHAVAGASAGVMALSKGAIHMLFMAKMKLAAMVTATVMLVGIGVGTVLVAAAPQRVQPGGQPPAQPVPRTPPVAATPGGIVFTGHTSPVTHVSASADASVLVSSGLEDGTIRVWDVAGRRCVRTIAWRNANLGYVFGKPTIKVPPGWTPVLAISPDGKWIAAAEEATPDERKAGRPDAWLRLIEVASGNEVHRIEVRNQPNVRLGPRYVAALAFSPDSKKLAVSTWAGPQGDPTIDLWDAPGGAHVAGRRRVARLDQGARCVVFSPDGQRLAFTNGRVPGGLALSKPDDLVQYESHGSPGAMVFSRDSTKLLGVDANGGKLMIWDAATGKLQQSGVIADLGNDTHGQRRLNLGATGLDLLVPGEGALFDLRGKGGLAHALIVSKIVTDVLLHPDGKRAILACGDGSVRIESLCPDGVKAAPDAGELSKAWAALGGDDAEKAYRATWALALSGERAVKAMAARIDEAVNVGQRFAGLIKQLNDNDSQARDAAEQKLAQTDLAGAAAMLAALDTLPQVPREPRDRIARVLPPIELRWRRAVRALELTGSAESRQLLARIAKAHPLATVKQDAAAVLAARR